MQWLKYKIICNENENILLDKKVSYSEENLAIAEREAYNGEFKIEDDGEEEIKKEPLSIEYGGTGATNKEDALLNLGLAVEDISDSFILQTEVQDKLPATSNIKVFKQGNVIHGSLSVEAKTYSMGFLFYVNRDYLARHLVKVDYIAYDADDMPLLDVDLLIVFRYSILPNQFVVVGDNIPANVKSLDLIFSYII